MHLLPSKPSVRGTRRVLGAVALALLIGCEAERPAPSAGAAPRSETERPAAPRSEAGARARRAVGPDLWRRLDAPRRAVLTEMGEALGEDGLRRFTRLRAALHRGDPETAAAELLDSRWARQAPVEVGRLALRMCAR